jgi:sugar phosphate isomerase/epimerase
MLDRRGFLYSAGIGGLSIFKPKRKRPSGTRLPIAFSTLGCPSWSWKKILDVAVEYGYAAVEMRGLEGTLNTFERPEFQSRNLSKTINDLASRKLNIVCFCSSTYLHEMDQVKLNNHLNEAIRYIDLAHAFGTPYVRVFGNKWVEGQQREVTIDNISSRLKRLGEYAYKRNVKVCLEAHGDFTDSKTLTTIMRKSGRKGVGLIWDAHHTFVSSNEDPEYTYRRLKPYIVHVQLKDSRPGGAEREYVLTGMGNVPVRRQVEVLARGGFDGYYSYEWEKYWHPKVEDPEVAIPHFARVVRQYMAGLSVPLR